MLPPPPWLDGVARDVRLAARGLRRTPAFTAVAVCSLALGFALAGSTASVVNAYLVRSLPYPGADRLYHVMYAPPGPWEPRGMTALDWKSVEDVVEFPIASAGDTFYVADDGHAVALRGLRVTAGFVEGLGVSVAAGRRLIEPDFLEGSEPVVLLGHSVWRDRFGSDPRAVGRLVRAEAEGRPGRPEAFRVVGVLAPGFYYGRDSRDAIDLVIPATSPVRAYMVRLRGGVSAAWAEQRISDAARQAATAPIPGEWPGVQLESAHERYVGNLRPVLAGVTVAASLVLVIVCSNVSLLVLLRATRRQKEVAVRLALGSGRRHIARMLLVETLLLCTGAAATGLAAAALALRAFAPLVEAQLGRPAPRGPSDIAVDSTVLLIAGAIGLIAAMVLSLAPLLTIWSPGLADALRGAGRVATDGRPMRRVRSAVLALEVAGALILLVACGLMVRSVVNMMRTDLGFDAGGLVRTRIVLRERNYPDAAAYRRFYEQFAGRVSALLESPVVFTNWPPFELTPSQIIETESGNAVNAGSLAVSAEYFALLGIDLRQGREFTAADVGSGEPVALVSETLARRLWPGGGAVGGRVRAVEPTPAGPSAGPWRTVVGIAADVRQRYEDTDRRDFYTPMMPSGRYGSFYVRAARVAPLLRETFRTAAADIDPDAVIDEPRSVASEDRALSARGVLAALLSGFAGVAVFLVVLGLYGATAYVVRQRHREVAIRLALGASTRQIVRLFLREGAFPLSAGTTAGLAGGAAVSRLLASRLYGVEPFDLPTLLAAGGLLSAAGLAAVCWPASRAAAGCPAAALQAE